MKTMYDAGFAVYGHRPISDMLPAKRAKERLVAEVVVAVSGVPIRLTDERWGHILLQHPEVASLRQAMSVTISNPDRVLETSTGELMAVKAEGSGRDLVVIYVESLTPVPDGFVVTAFVTRHTAWLNKRRQVWP